MVCAMTRDEALTTFDAAPAVEPEFMIGTWRGRELPTGHPLDGLLALSGWWGKQFVNTETVHPLLFPTRDGAALWALDPRLVPVGAVLRVPFLPRRPLPGLVSALRPLAGTRTPKARLRITDDFIRLKRNEGMPLKEAVVRSAATRAQPILLTAVAAMLGASFILDDPIFNGLATSLIFGISISTLLTLVVIPVLYFMAARQMAEGK